MRWIATLVLVLVLAVGVADAQKLTLTWVDGSGGTASFIIQRAQASTGPWTTLTTVPAKTITYRDIAIKYQLLYCYRVAATLNGKTSTYSNVSCGRDQLYTLTVLRNGTNLGSVTSIPMGIACGTVCGHLFDDGVAIKLTASKVVTWSGRCVGTSTTCIFTMPAFNTSVTATFQ